jgi:hypothetical protein
MNKHPNRNTEKYRTKRNEYARKYYREKGKAKQIANARKWELKMQTWIAQIKTTLSCSVCKENDAVCLDFHHRDENLKDFSIGDALNLGCGKDRILKEIAKCEVLCANCHRKLHGGRFSLLCEPPN